MPYHVLGMTDGSVAVMQTVGNATVEECLAKWPQAQRENVATIVKDYAPEILPQDRTYRDAWTLKVALVVHDMDRARVIHRDRLRAERKPALEAMDLAYLRADEAGDAKAKADVVDAKQALRDVTDAPEIDAAASVDDLKALTLDVLTAVPAQADVAAVDEVGLHDNPA